MKVPELLAPAGSPEALDAAVGEGADGVYLGLKSFNARMRSANFAFSQFEGALRSLHRMGRRVYVTVNTVFEQREADRMYQLLKYLASLGPDGLIVQDFGIIRMVRDHFPSLKLHASTQMNIASARGVNLLSKQGFSRVVLARELSGAEIRDLRSRTNMELEVFVHGALCVSASGLCLFSSYLGGKSANRGMCTQACRRRYRRDAGDEGGYYFSPADLQLLERVPELADAGINSFKIEGRMKSAEYVGTVVSAYRRVIDALAGDREKSIREGLAILRNDFARKKTFFYYGLQETAPVDGPQEAAPDTAPVDGLPGDGPPEAAPDAAPVDGPPEAAPDAPADGLPVEAAVENGRGLPDWLSPGQDGGTGIPLGGILRVRGSGAERQGLIPPGPVLPGPGDSVRLHRADDRDRRSHKVIAAEWGERRGLWISLPEGFGPGDSVYLIQTRQMSRRYPPVIKGDLDDFRRKPGREKAPELDLPPAKKREIPVPEGI